MKSNHWGLMLLAVGLVVGMLVGGGMPGRQAEAQVAGPVQPPQQRFQISAWAFATGGGASLKSERGCYIIDTVTGEMWHVAANHHQGQATRIAEKLR